MISWKAQQTNRLLTEVRNQFPNYSLKDIRWSIDHNRCWVNQRVERFGSTLVKKGDLISIHLDKRPLLQKERGRTLYEDDHLLVYDKPPFLTSEQLSLCTASHLVHRLDRDTSGVIVLAKSDGAKQELENQFRKRAIEKEYFAIVEGNPGEEGVISGCMAPLSKREGATVWGMSSTGLSSQTTWKRLTFSDRFSLLLCTPYTGRTHQIRVHLAHIGYPVLGDVTYGSRQQPLSLFRPLLHSYRITFCHLGVSHTFIAPVPSDFLPDALNIPTCYRQTF